MITNKDKIAERYFYLKDSLLQALESNHKEVFKKFVAVFLEEFPSIMNHVLAFAFPIWNDYENTQFFDYIGIKYEKDFDSYIKVFDYWVRYFLFKKVDFTENFSFVKQVFKTNNCVNIYIKCVGDEAIPELISKSIKRKTILFLGNNNELIVYEVNGVGNIEQKFEFELKDLLNIMREWNDLLDIDIKNKLREELKQLKEGKEIELLEKQKMVIVPFSLFAKQYMEYIEGQNEEIKEKNEEIKKKRKNFVNKLTKEQKEKYKRFAELFLSDSKKRKEEELINYAVDVLMRVSNPVISGSMFIPSIEYIKTVKEFRILSAGGLALYHDLKGTQQLEKFIKENDLEKLLLFIHLLFKGIFGSFTQTHLMSQSLSAAIAAIMARNMSHNIGSHVLADLANFDEV